MICTLYGTWGVNDWNCSTENFIDILIVRFHHYHCLSLAGFDLSANHTATADYLLLNLIITLSLYPKVSKLEHIVK